MSAFNELHPVVQKHLNFVEEDSTGMAYCGCTFGVSEVYGRDVVMCRFHSGMSIGAEDAAEWEEQG